MISSKLISDLGRNVLISIAGSIIAGFLLKSLRIKSIPIMKITWKSGMIAFGVLFGAFVLGGLALQKIEEMKLKKYAEKMSSEEGVTS